jgi:hypothetical protein
MSFSGLYYDGQVIRQSDGPAIKLVSVTRRKHRAEFWYFSRETVTVQGGFGAVFGIQVQIFVKSTRVAVQC